VVTWAASTPGVEGAAITLGALSASDGDGVASLVISGIPVGQRSVMARITSQHCWEHLVRRTHVDSI